MNFLFVIIGIALMFGSLFFYVGYVWEKNPKISIEVVGGLCACICLLGFVLMAWRF